MTYNRSFNQREPRQIYAVAMIKEHILAGRDQVVTKGLAALAESERAMDVSLYEYRVLRPWLGALMAEPGLCQLRLCDFVGAHDLAQVQRRVGHMRERPEYAKMSDFELCRRTFLSLIHKMVRDGGLHV